MRGFVLSLSALVVLSSPHLSASVQPVRVDGKMAEKPPRWMFNGQPPRASSATIEALERVKRHLYGGRFRECHQAAASGRGAVPSLASWLAVMEAHCAELAFDQGRLSAGELATALERIERNPTWFIYGAQKDGLRRAAASARFALLRKDVRMNRPRAWEAVDRLILIKDWLTTEQKAEVYRFAGELAFIEQKMRAARGFVLQSLQLVDSSELREKLTAIEKALSKEEAEELVRDASFAKASGETAGEDELKLAERVKVALTRGDLVSVAEDASSLMRKYPSGPRAVWAQERVLEAYFRVSKEDGKKIFSAKKKILHEMKKLDGQRVLDWAGTLYSRGEYAEALDLAQNAVKKLKGAYRLKDALKLAALSALYTGDLDRAEEKFKDLESVAAGSEEAKEALFRLGLISYRKKDRSKAVAFLERLLSQAESERFELSARYWLWRALQKEQPVRAEEERLRLIAKFPLTYYGLRATAEGRGGVVELPENKSASPVSAQVWMTEAQRSAWERFHHLLRAGWLEEAQLELATLPPPQTESERLVLAGFWAAALDYRKTVDLAQQAWPRQERMDGQRYIRLSFPSEFVPLLQKEAKNRNVDLFLLQSLIRQESAYYPKAVSRSNALGLMQLIPSTAQEAAEMTGRKNLKVPDDLFDPKLNIELGTFYLSRMIERFNGHVPLALAAYNAGPTRLKRWMDARSSLETWSPDSNPENEIWIDELPWSETNFYVKSILKNYIVYKMLDQRQVTLGDPIWR